MAKHFDPWSVLVCYKTNSLEEEQEALKEIVAELERNKIWRKKVNTKRRSRSYYFREYNIKPKIKRLIIRRTHE